MLYWRLRTSTDQACISLTLALHGHSLSTIIHLVQGLPALQNSTGDLRAEDFVIAIVDSQGQGAHADIQPAVPPGGRFSPLLYPASNLLSTFTLSTLCLESQMNRNCCYTC